jgi:hypothetical protein
MSKMASHESFGHPQHKLWAKEGSGIKLAVWLPTTKVKNRPDPGVCRWIATHHSKALEESYKFALDLITIRGLSWELWVPKVPGFQTRTVSRLLLGNPGNKSIWMWVPWSNAENTIWGKVVASPESGPWWVKWVQGRPWLVPTLKGCRMSSNQLVGWFWMQDRITK